MTTCPFCGEEVLPTAKKCKHCHEFLDPVLIRSLAPTRQEQQPRPVTTYSPPPTGICSSLSQLGKTQAILMIRSMSAENIELAFREPEYGMLSDDLQAEMATRLTVLNNRITAKVAASAKKNRVIAGILGILLGGFGAHKFYLGRAEAWIYLIFFWTYIPMVIGFIEGIMYLATTDEDFERKFG